MTKIKVLDKGYVSLVKRFGSDLDIVNSARASFDKESFLEPDGSLKENDIKLLAFLLRENHQAPFRHSGLTFEVYAPLIVARQWWRYAVASSAIEDQNGWSESSRRYVTENEEFYIPYTDSWRAAPANKKQGSGENLSPEEGIRWTQSLEEFVDRGLSLYDEALDAGLAPEQARLFLPAYALYVRWRWTPSLATVLHFLEQRLDSHAQYEIQLFAGAVKEIASQEFPHTFGLIYDKKD